MAEAHSGMTGRLQAGCQRLVLLLLLIAATPAIAQERTVRGYSFSDELGGFTIHRVTGRGTRSDPIVIEQHLPSVDPVTLVIRRHETQLPDEPAARAARWVAIHVKLIVFNGSGRVWQGFEVELQEILHQPSVRQDGLSFDQGAVVPEAVRSSRFRDTKRLFEPYDRILFQQGHVNPGDVVDFTVHITDPTPARIFYLLLDPQLLFS